MHHCLTISEILHRIFRFCVAPGPHPLNTLAAATRAYLSPLLKCLPSELWFEERQPIHNGKTLVTFHLRQLPGTMSEWNTVHKHVHRVKKLGLDLGRWNVGSKVTYHVSPAAFQAILMCCTERGWPDQSNAAFLLNLEKLSWDWNGNNQSAFRNVLCLASSNLKSFDMCFFFKNLWMPTSQLPLLKCSHHFPTSSQGCRH
ncbi:unnamed protein product [Somion occarium]|uniref:Uncharacterized protein n=1 Tax=Somion occarium TaxID=3059160 RepID=A0ABP1DWM7_9APHY